MDANKNLSTDSIMTQDWVVRVVQYLNTALPTFRGKHRLLGLFLALRGTRWVRLGSLGAELDLSDPFEREAALGLFSSEVLSSIKEFLRPGECFCDCGGHVGILSVNIADHLDAGGQVYAFEPSPPTFSRISRTFKALSDSPCALVALPIALGAESSAAVEIHVSAQHGWSTLSKQAATVGQSLGVPLTSVELVRQTSLDHFYLEEQGHRLPQVIKIDVEGWEEDVLRGSERLLSTAPPRAIVVERNDAILNAMNRSWLTIEEYLLNHDYRIHKIMAEDVVFVHAKAYDQLTCEGTQERQ